MSYRGQVLLYSLLISERFKNANPENILLFIMDENLRDPHSQSFQYLKQTRNELDSLIIGRNELAKWNKRNNTPIKMPFLDISNNIDEIDFVEEPLIVQYPPMINRISECKNCF